MSWLRVQIIEGKETVAAFYKSRRPLSRQMRPLDTKLVRFAHPNPARQTVFNHDDHC